MFRINTLSRSVLAILVFLSAASSLRAQTPLKSAAFTPGSWSLVLLPDTQYYSLSFPPVHAQTHWIVENKDKYDIRYVLGLGDITDKNTDREWRNAKKAIRPIGRARSLRAGLRQSRLHAARQFGLGPLGHQ